jgi:hypothetical protein
MFLESFMDEDLDKMDQATLLSTAKAMRTAIRKHRDSSGHNLCWFHPEMWCLLPDSPSSAPDIPAWPEFICNCAQFRSTLERPESKVVHSVVEAKVVSVDVIKDEVQLEYTNFSGGVKLFPREFPCMPDELIVGKSFKLFKIMVTNE